MALAETLAKPEVQRKATLIYRGLSASAIVWLYATFASHTDISKLEAQNQSQWQAISKLKQDVAVNSAIIEYYFHGSTVTKTNTIP